MKDKHKNKLKLARKNMDIKEIKAKISPFDSQWWNERKNAIILRVRGVESRQKEVSRLRKEKKT